MAEDRLPPQLGPPLTVATDPLGPAFAPHDAVAAVCCPDVHELAADHMVPCRPAAWQGCRRQSLRLCVLSVLLQRIQPVTPTAPRALLHVARVLPVSIA